MPMKRWLYPKDWNQIAAAVKAKAGYVCTECGHTASPSRGISIGVHHIDGDPQNNRETNLVALCNRCHLPKHAGGIGEVPGQKRLFDAEADLAPPGAQYRICSRSVSWTVSYPECEIRREEKFNNPKFKDCSLACHEFRKHEREKANERTNLG